MISLKLVWSTAALHRLSEILFHSFIHSFIHSYSFKALYKTQSNNDKV